MAEHFAAEIPRDGVLRAERKLKSPLIKRANIGCLGALHTLANDRALLFRLFNSILFSLFGTNRSNFGERAESMTGKDVSLFAVAINRDQCSRILCSAGDDKRAARHVNLAVALNASDLAPSATPWRVPRNKVACF